MFRATLQPFFFKKFITSPYNMFVQPVRVVLFTITDKFALKIIELNKY